MLCAFTSNITHPHPHTTSHSRKAEAGALKYTNATPFPEDSKKQPGTPASFFFFDSKLVTADRKKGTSKLENPSSGSQ